MGESGVRDKRSDKLTRGRGALDMPIKSYGDIKMSYINESFVDYIVFRIALNTTLVNCQRGEKDISPVPTSTRMSPS